MAKLQILIPQVKRNCDISDARYWGNYTLCTLLLLMKELYKFEHGVRPWEDVRKEAILGWISDRERLWAELEREDFSPIKIADSEFLPFDSDSINALLLPEGMFYGAGYGQWLKPMFFLAGLDRRESVEAYDVYITGNEYARDMSPSPAMLQDRKIIIRKDVILLLLWDKFIELRMDRTKSSDTLAFAFAYYGILPDEEPSLSLNEKMVQVAESEVESYIYHEVGELSEGERLGGQWKDFMFSISGSRAELLARGIKDILSDTSDNGMLRHLIEQRKAGSLAFYISSLRGYRKLLFKEVIESYKRFVETGFWNEIDDMRIGCYKRVMRYAETMLDLYSKEKERIRLIKRMEKEFSHLF